MRLTYFHSIPTLNSCAEFSAAGTTFDLPFGDDTSTLFRKDNTFQESVQFTYNRGQHSLTYGGQIMRQQFNPEAATYARGSYTFSPRYTASTQGGTNGNGFADFLLGLPFSALALEGNAYENGRSTGMALSRRIIGMPCRGLRSTLVCAMTTSALSTTTVIVLPLSTFLTSAWLSRLQEGHSLPQRDLHRGRDSSFRLVSDCRVSTFTLQYRPHSLRSSCRPGLFDQADLRTARRLLVDL